MDNFVDYYELLHVQPSAPVAVIKASYRTMMQKLNHHPDRGGDVAFAQLLNRAADTLCNDDTRAAYDALRRQDIEKHGGPRREKAAQTDRTSGFSWGEPGGSPGDSDRHETDSKQSQHHQATLPSTLIPASAHCLFCLTPYPTGGEMNNTTYSAESNARASYVSPTRCSCCNGARTRIEQLPASSDAELRRMHRQLHSRAAEMWTTWPSKVVTMTNLVDFSLNGCALSTGQSLKANRVVMIETTLFNAICTVRYCQQTGVAGRQPVLPGTHSSGTSQDYIVGLAFNTLDMQATPGTLLNASA